jgi:hypothetical protein
MEHSSLVNAVNKTGVQNNVHGKISTEGISNKYFINTERNKRA